MKERRKDMYKFFAFIDRMKYIKRWALMRNIHEESIMEHSQQVSILAHALASIKNKIYGGNVDIKKVLLIAQYHEVSEVITGDLPTPVKYFNPEIKTAYKEIEKNACKKLIEMLPKELKEDYESCILPDTDSYEWLLVKKADRLSAYIKCLEEIKLGNGEFKKAKDVIEKELVSSNMPEVNYFMQNIAPSYSITLDEIE